MRVGRQYPGTVDTFDARVFLNNHVGFALVLFGFGIRASFRLRPLWPNKKESPDAAR